MKNGHLFKEKLEYTVEKFKTKTGLFDFFVGSAVWAYLIRKYIEDIFRIINDNISFINPMWLQEYVSYLIFATATAIIGLGLSFVIYTVSHWIFTKGKNYLK